MGLVGGILKEKEFVVHSPLQGKVLDIEETPDKVFTSNIIGKGCAIEPNLGLISAPVNGHVEIFKTNHLLIFEPQKGVYVVLHFGIGTSSLEGRGFERLLKPSKKNIDLGDPLVKCDLEYIKANSKSTISPIIVSDERVKDVELLVKPGDMIKIGDPIMKVELK